MSEVMLEPVWHKTTQEVGFKLSRQGTSKALFFKPDELRALRSLIDLVLVDNHAPTTS
jgi:hypothetical protein